MILGTTRRPQPTNPLSQTTLSDSGFGVFGFRDSRPKPSYRDRFSENVILITQRFLYDYAILEYLRPKVLFKLIRGPFVKP